MQQNDLLTCPTFYSFTEHVAVNSQEYPQRYTTAPQFTVLTRILLDYKQSFFSLNSPSNETAKKKWWPFSFESRTTKANQRLLVVQNQEKTRIPSLVESFEWSEKINF